MQSSLRAARQCDQCVMRAVARIATINIRRLNFSVCISNLPDCDAGLVGQLRLPGADELIIRGGRCISIGILSAGIGMEQLVVGGAQLYTCGQVLAGAGPWKGRQVIELQSG